ncbi:MAG: hypothetical protein IKC75_04000 [Clostridia bacterium]|nr:hypothetical protein [Clostridia bacterium]
MKKNFKFYVLGWVALLGLFNLLAFIIPAWPTLEKFTPSFWIGWGFTIGAFLGQLICAWYAFKEESAKKTFYNISLFSVSYAGLITMFVVSMICIIVTPLPYWIAAIACSIVLIANIVTVAKAKMAIDVVASVDEKIEKATAFIYDMREESESLFARVKSEGFKPLCKKVRDAFKFSDPMSNAGLASVEVDIKNHFEAFSKAISEGKADVVTYEADEVLALIAERNNKCKKLK